MPNFSVDGTGHDPKGQEMKDGPPISMTHLLSPNSSKVFAVGSLLTAWKL